MVESTGLENRRTLIAYLGFKSLSLRHIDMKEGTSLLVPFFVFETIDNNDSLEPDNCSSFLFEYTIT